MSLTNERLAAIKEGIAIDLKHINLLVKEYLEGIGETTDEIQWSAFAIKYKDEPNATAHFDVCIKPWSVKSKSSNDMVALRYDTLISGLEV